MLDSFFDELCKIGAVRFQKGAAAPAAIAKGGSKLLKALPWLGAAGAGIGGTLVAQDVGKTYRLGKQVRKAHPGI